MRTILTALIGVVAFAGLTVAYETTLTARSVATVAYSGQERPDVTEDADKGITLSDDTDVSAGVCRTFVGSIVIHQCVPLYSPEGGTVLRVEEDGSARYSDGWVIDAESRTFDYLP